MNISAAMDEVEVLQVKLDVLKREHRELDVDIQAQEALGPHDMLSVRRLKKRKLWLKDQIAQIEDRLLPDITA